MLCHAVLVLLAASLSGTEALAAVPLGGAAALRNAAVVFLKPHAANDACESFVRSLLEKSGVEVGPTIIKVASQINEQKLIDQHYGALATLAMDTQPAALSLSAAAEESFKTTFGKQWSATLPSMLRNDEALKVLGVDGMTLESMWRGGVQVKLAPGTYVSKLDLSTTAHDGALDECFTINGFYPAMRQKFVEDGASVRCMVCEWDEAQLSWKAFRRELIGATNPADALPGSVRSELLARWKELGLADEPSMGLNGVHASAGPLEGLKERCIWAGASLEKDELAQQLVSAGGLSGEVLDEWLRDNPAVCLGGQTDKVFDLTEELSAAAVVELVQQQQQQPCA